jgi:hypothetical protein
MLAFCAIYTVGWVAAVGWLNIGAVRASRRARGV